MTVIPGLNIDRALGVEQAIRAAVGDYLIQLSATGCPFQVSTPEEILFSRSDENPNEQYIQRRIDVYNRFQAVCNDAAFLARLSEGLNKIFGIMPKRVDEPTYTYEVVSAVKKWHLPKEYPIDIVVRQEDTEVSRNRVFTSVPWIVQCVTSLEARGGVVLDNELIDIVFLATIIDNVIRADDDRCGRYRDFCDLLDVVDE